MMRFVHRLWRVVVVVAATLAFLLAWFLDYDGLGQALGFGPVAGRIALAGIVALVIALVAVRLTREPAAGPAAAKKPARKPRRKQPAKKRKAVTTRSAKPRRSTRRG